MSIEIKVKMFPMMKRLPNDSVVDEVVTPIGPLTVVASSKGLHAILWDHYANDSNYKAILDRLPRNSHQKFIQQTRKELAEYFEGKRRKFTIPICMDGTEFQEKAWKGLTEIPYGKTLSYQDHAVQLGGANKVRAVGGANGRNPISIVVPCHRVIAKNGTLNGFGGGLKVKKFLLELESKHTNASLS